MPLGIPHSTFLDWSEADQDKALGFLRAKRELCKCGTRKAEWDKDRFAYVAVSERCPGCELIEMEQSNVPEGEKGVYIRLLPREAAEALTLAQEG